MNKKMTDQEFIEAFRAYNGSIYNFVYLRVGSKDLAQDLAQEAFLKLWNKRKLFNKDKSSVKTWVYRIARNLLIDHYRKKSNKEINIDNNFEIQDDSNNTDRELDLKFIYTKLKELDEFDQTLIILKYIEELSNEEIAEIIEKNVNTTKVSIFRALEKLKRIINLQNNEVQ